MSWDKLLIRGARIKARLAVKHVKISKQVLSILGLMNKRAHHPIVCCHQKHNPVFLLLNILIIPVTRICVFNLKPKKII